MTTSNFLIGPIKDGLRKDVKPYAIPEDAFEVLTNAYQWRGRIVRRPGYNLLGTLANGTPVMGLRTRELFGIDVQQLIAFDTTTAYSFSGSSFSVLSSVMPVTWSGTNYQFFWTTNYANAFWATNNVSGLHGWLISNFNSAAGTGTSATVNVIAAGNTVAVNDSVYFVNVSGGGTLPNNLIFSKVIAIVTPNSEFTVQATSFPAGVNSFTNGNPSTGFVMDSLKSISGQDGIRYYANCTTLPGTAVGNTWVNYNPPIDGNTILTGALLIFPYKGYFVFLSTWEYDGSVGASQNYQQRARWVAQGTPYYSSPVPNTPFLFGVNPEVARRDLFGRGSATDAPTNETIVGAAFIRDMLVVYFERSTWRLRFVNNAQDPFVWERVNVEYGSDCTFGCVPFDKGLMTMGNRGIVISDGNDTLRFDEKIPDDVFNLRQNNQGFQRVYGIRTFRSRLVYWTYPSLENPLGTFPDKVLVFNYDTKNWSYFDDTFTCFGYFYPATTAQTWAEMKDNWSSYGNITWDSGTESQGFETVVAGNQQGFVFLLEQDSAQNDPSLNISNIVGNVVTSNNHNLKDGTWVTLSGITGTTYPDGATLNGRNFKVSNPTNDPNIFGLNEFKSIAAGNASGTIFTYTVAYVPIIPGSVDITVGALTFVDLTLNGVLYSTGLNTGTIDYNTGLVTLIFSPSIGSTAVHINVVSYSPQQLIVPIDTTGAYTGGGQIAVISNFDVQTKIFNFFGDDQRSRLSKIDFYVDSTQNGQFTCNVFSDSSNTIVNEPLSDNLQSNVVITSPNPYQFGSNCDETIFRLYADCIAQTVQMQLTLSDRQIAVNTINTSDFELISMIVSLRRGGRLV